MSESEAPAESGGAIEPTAVFTPAEVAESGAPDLAPPASDDDTPPDAPPLPPSNGEEVVPAADGAEEEPEEGEDGPDGAEEGPDGAEEEPEEGEDGPDDALPVLHSGRIVDVIADALTFMLVIARLALAAMAMRSLSQAVKGAYSYVEDCAKTVDGLADVAAALNVDDMVTSSHHDAAAMMRGSLALADALADEAAEMSTEFDNAARDHESDYGDVNEAMQAGPYDVGEREWYSNR
ncbi:hypothetical protein OG590_40040 (plasmid) [Streptomyces goshikiensis]|uniref:hypothetical protein n=1 Tax=Streptomyces goshikiensis TaxID=1942 RepID=UPI002F91AC51|nr:hypothetical protein OG590_40040 [Streptomyces goshikiensis]